MATRRSSRPWRRKRAIVLAQDNRCRLNLPGCTGHATTADHIIPVSQGGTDALHNLRPACAHCNYSRGNKPTEPKTSQRW